MLSSIFNNMRYMNTFSRSLNQGKQLSLCSKESGVMNNRYISTIKLIKDHQKKSKDEKYNSVSLNLNDPLTNDFFDKMSVSSKLTLAPPINMYIHYPPNIRRVYFDRVMYYNNIELGVCDQNAILNKFKLLSNMNFIPTTPYLGYLPYYHKRCYQNWFIWSYTNIIPVQGKTDFLNKFYDLGYHKTQWMEKYVLDSFLKYLSENK